MTSNPSSNIPKVTVLVPVFNAEKYLKESLESILNQYYKNLELLIINDGSTDNSANIVHSFSDHRIRLIHNGENKGLIRTLNYGLELAKGTYIARHDADDIAIIDRIEKQVNFLDENPDIDLIGGYAELIDEKGNPFTTIQVPTNYEDILKTIYNVNCFIHPSVMYRASTARAIGGYHISAIYAEDYDLWLKFIERSKVVNLAEKLVRYRIHPDQISQKKLKLQRLSANRVRSTAFTRCQQARRLRDGTTLIMPTFLQRLRGVPPSIGSDYRSWINIYKSMGHNYYVKLLMQELLVAPFSGDAWLEILNIIRWYKYRLSNIKII